MTIKKMSGLSNACYRVELQSDVQLPPAQDSGSGDAKQPRVFLYRKFECEIVDK